VTSFNAAEGGPDDMPADVPDDVPDDVRDDVPDDVPFLVDDDGVHTRRAVFARVDAARGAVAGGIATPLQGSTSTSLLLGLLTARAAGGVPVLLSPRLPPAAAQAAATTTTRGLAALSPEVRARLADVTFTSGTTGTPRAVAHTHVGHDVVARAGNAHVAFGPGHRWLLSLPLVHVGGLGIVSRALVGGGALAMPRPGEAVVDAALRLQATHLSLVRAQLVDLLEHPRLAALVPSLRLVLVGGGPTPAALFARAVAAGVPVAQTWGMTETHAQVATSLPGAPGTCGRPLPGRRVRVDDDGGLHVGGPGLAAGFVDEGGLVPLPVDADGWFATGDRGFLDEAGRVVVTGRAGLRIVSGGEKLEPEAIEAVLLGLPDVVDAVVVGVPHPRWGERPVVFVRAAAPTNASCGFASATTAAWAAAVSERLPKTWVPDAFYPWPDDVEGGKAARAALRARVRGARDPSSV
jgi:O-succinylbenzoic acid--CoA ligase